MKEKLKVLQISESRYGEPDKYETKFENKLVLWKNYNCKLSTRAYYDDFKTLKIDFDPDIILINFNLFNLSSSNLYLYLKMDIYLNAIKERFPKSKLLFEISTESLEKLDTKAKNIGLRWYNKLYRAFDKNIIQPGQEHRFFSSAFPWLGTKSKIVAAIAGFSLGAWWFNFRVDTTLQEQRARLWPNDEKSKQEFQATLADQLTEGLKSQLEETLANDPEQYQATLESFKFTPREFTPEETKFRDPPTRLI